MKVGVFGAGRIGTLHARTLAGLSSVDAVVVCDIEREKADRLADEIGASVASTPDELFAMDIDSVVVASSTLTHAALVTAAVARGLPTFCEKPIASDLATTREVVATVERSGVPVMVGFQRRSDPAYLALRRRIAAGKVGEPYLVRMVVGDDQLPPAEYVSGSGGIFRDQSVHDFDIVRWLTGQEIVEVFAAGGNLTGRPEYAAADDVDTAATVLRLHRGTLAVLTSSRISASGYDVRLEVAGSKQIAAIGVVSAPTDSNPEGVATATAPPGGFVERFRAAYQAEMRRFIRLAGSSGENPCPPSDALAAFVVADAASTSRRECRPVRLEHSEVGK
ncbi:Gfo/Idh/MocA family oxidoreductase [Actinopolymorpha sp. B17G11]|uniref:Gfo/Idh/MocA family protein n=1 Tax=Actinopolymorpha sp. B17G11 TaxID=3160861 RepID=UPI0032E3782E